MGGRTEVRLIVRGPHSVLDRVRTLSEEGKLENYSGLHILSFAWEIPPGVAPDCEWWQILPEGSALQSSLRRCRLASVRYRRATHKESAWVAVERELRNVGALLQNVNLQPRLNRLLAEHIVPTTVDLPCEEVSRSAWVQFGAVRSWQQGNVKALSMLRSAYGDETPRVHVYSSGALSETLQICLASYRQGILQSIEFPRRKKSFHRRMMVDGLMSVLSGASFAAAAILMDDDDLQELVVAAAARNMSVGLSRFTLDEVVNSSARPLSPKG